MQTRNIGKGFLDTPVDPGFRESPAKIADDREIVNYIAKRRGFDQQNTQRLLNTSKQEKLNYPRNPG